MITYDSRNWLAALALHRSDTFRKLLPMLVLVGLLTWAIGFVEIEYLKLSKGDYVSNLPVMHSLLGFAISMLLVFRTNTAYDRWWEARRLWGQLVNVSRNTAIKLAAMLPADDARGRAQYAVLIGRFAKELRLHLLSEKTRTALDAAPHPELEGLDRNKHVPAQLASMLHARAHRAYRDGVISGDQLIALATDLTAFMDICGGCERIKNTPIPYSYSTFLKKFIVIYSLTLPFGFVFSLGYIAIPVVIFVFYVLASLELIAEEIEDPFGLDANDLPLDRLAAMIGANVDELLA
ncbi:MAG TPA: bestrophin family ion channel [Polyangiaceae bacterium]|nr:bestrophin family ion channel [Polyangiaceae bacterium]